MDTISDDINSGVMRYVLADASVDETMDSFMFNVRDSLPTAVTGNLFYIRWSVFSLAERNYTVSRLCFNQTIYRFGEVRLKKFSE